MVDRIQKTGHAIKHVLLPTQLFGCFEVFNISSSSLLPT